MKPPLHRLALSAAAFVTVLVVGGALIADGYLAAAGSVPVETASLATPAPTEVIYVRPAARPQVIHVTQTESPAPPQVIRQVVPGAGDDGDDRDGGD